MNTVAVPATVAVVDDHPLYRSAIIGVFDGVPDLTVTAECASVEELEARLDSDATLARVVLLDLSLPGCSGADAVAALTRRGLAVLVVSGAAVRTQLADVVANGALGFVTKAARSEEILTATRTVAAGDGYFAPDVASMLGEAMRSRKTPLDMLTARERELLVLLAAGCTDRTIAVEMTITLATVRSHLDRIRTKTGCRRRAELTRLAIGSGLADPH